MARCECSTNGMLSALLTCCTAQWMRHRAVVPLTQHYTRYYAVTLHPLLHSNESLLCSNAQPITAKQRFARCCPGIVAAQPLRWPGAEGQGARGPGTMVSNPVEIFANFSVPHCVPRPEGPPLRPRRRYAVQRACATARNPLHCAPAARHDLPQKVARWCHGGSLG